MLLVVAGPAGKRPPVPRGLSSGAVSATAAERWPTAPQMPPDRIIEGSVWRYTREDAARTSALMTQIIVATNRQDIPGMPDCRGVSCDGMCANAECLGNHPSNVPLPPLKSAVDTVWLIVPWAVLAYGISALIYLIADIVTRAH